MPFRFFVIIFFVFSCGSESERKPDHVEGNSIEISIDLPDSTIKKINNNPKIPAILVGYWVEHKRISSIFIDSEVKYSSVEEAERLSLKINSNSSFEFFKGKDLLSSGELEVKSSPFPNFVNDFEVCCLNIDFISNYSIKVSIGITESGKLMGISYTSHGPVYLLDKE